MEVDDLRLLVLEPDLLEDVDFPRPVPVEDLLLLVDLDLLAEDLDPRLDADRDVFDPDVLDPDALRFRLLVH